MAKRKNRPGRKRGRVKISQELAEAYGVKIPKEQASTDRYLSPNDIGKILNLTGEAVKQWIYHRKLPAVKLANGYWQVKVADFETFLRMRHEIGKRRILVAGKNESMADIAGMLGEFGHEVSVTHGYADALLKAMNGHPSMCVINVSLKETSPWKLVERIRTTKALKKTPILLVSDNELSDTDSDLAVKMGVQGFLKCPVDKPTLLAAVSSAMNLAMA